MKIFVAAVLPTALGLLASTNAFVIKAPNPTVTTKSSTELNMALDLVTNLRTEWIGASICTNQIPSEAKSVLQIGTEDGRIVNFVPRTIEEIFTSSVEEGGELSISSQRQLKQQRERRGTGAKVRYVDQPADDLKETKDASIDVVVSLQAAQRMVDNGQDWKKSIREAARVLKPGGRFVFVEQTEVNGEKFMDVVAAVADNLVGKDTAEDGKEEPETYPIFELVGYDDVDLVIIPHIAGVVQKTEYAGLTKDQIEKKASVDEKDRISELSISAFERGLKKRKKKKKNKKKGFDDESKE